MTIVTNQMPSVYFSIDFEVTYSIRRVIIDAPHGTATWFAVTLESETELGRHIHFGSHTCDSLVPMKKLSHRMFGGCRGLVLILKAQIVCVRGLDQLQFVPIANNQRHNSLLEQITVRSFLGIFSRGVIGKMHGYSGPEIDPPKKILNEKDFEANVLDAATSARLREMKRKFAAAGDVDGVRSVLNWFATSAISYLWITHKFVPSLAVVKSLLVSEVESETECAAFEAMIPSIKERLKRVKAYQYQTATSLLKGKAKESLSVATSRPPGYLAPLNIRVKHGENFLKAVIELDGSPNELALLFYSKAKLALVQQSKNFITDVFVDGSFFGIPTKESQLLVFMVKEAGIRAIPLFYALVSSKTAATYSLLLARATAIVGFEPGQRIIAHCDFEMGLARSLSAHFKVQPCFFHGNQAVFRYSIQAKRDHKIFLKLTTNSPRPSVPDKQGSSSVPRKTLPELQEVRRSVLNKLKCLFFIQGQFVDSALRLIRDGAMPLEMKVIQMAGRLLRRYSDFLPINPIENRTNNYAEAFFSSFGQNSFKKNSLHEFMHKLLERDRLTLCKRVEARKERSELDNIFTAFFNFQGTQGELSDLLAHIDDVSAALQKSKPETGTCDARKKHSHLTLNRRNLAEFTAGLPKMSVSNKAARAKRIKIDK